MSAGKECGDILEHLACFGDLLVAGEVPTAGDIAEGNQMRLAASTLLGQIARDVGAGFPKLQRQLIIAARLVVAGLACSVELRSFSGLAREVGATTRLPSEQKAS